MINLYDRKDIPKIDKYLNEQKKIFAIRIEVQNRVQKIEFFLYPDNLLEIAIFDENKEIERWDTDENLKLIFGKLQLTEDELLIYAYPHIRDSLGYEFIYISN